jgi:hypothetical protein
VIPYLQNIARAKWIGGMAQVVEYLLCKYEALSSNSSPTKKKKKKEIQILLIIWVSGPDET